MAFPSQTSATENVFGAITTEIPLTLESYMPENGVIFSDGIDLDFIQFNAGTTATISLNPQKGQLIFNYVLRANTSFITIYAGFYKVLRAGFLGLMEVGIACVLGSLIS
ncbi:MAG: hypothetical protein C9356_02840 [Oleiphilus sp.]|nr:MAG: hypothetical protein C9356_02840 [Oleiphilus sp.]